MSMHTLCLLAVAHAGKTFSKFQIDSNSFQALAMTIYSCLAKFWIRSEYAQKSYETAIACMKCVFKERALQPLFFGTRMFFIYFFFIFFFRILIIPMALSKFKKTFDLQIPTKKFFPHQFNKVVCAIIFLITKYRMRIWTKLWTDYPQNQLMGTVLCASRIVNYLISGMKRTVRKSNSIWTTP